MKSVEVGAVVKRAVDASAYVSSAVETVDIGDFVGRGVRPADEVDPVAQVPAEGRKIWYDHPELEAEDLPSAVYGDGFMSWGLGAIFHRDRLPAVVDAEGGVQFWMHGDYIAPSGVSDVIRTSFSGVQYSAPAWMVEVFE